jgi:hypothetical protein
MKKLLFALSILSIVVLIISTWLFFNEKINIRTNNFWLLIGTISWFVTAPFWMTEKKT